MISAKNISKTYDNKKVLDNVSIEIKKGEIVSIVGPSGAGKTTLLHVLSTLDFADKNDKSALFLNEIRIADLKQKEISKFRNSQIGFIFQFHELLPEFTALENVCIPGMIRGDKPKELESRAEKLLKTLDLVHIKNQKPSELSGGEQQRVAVARALINEPSILFADEPSGNLDSKSADNLHQLFFDIRDRLKITIVIVTHNKKLADMADRKLSLVDGKWVK
ncbi:MAG: ABC transporter ATP-binding protein [Cryomorphaceae bacterium]|jgi:lipoprotein-releasing system ATP-binding protein|nr:MAG: ABC transporter ATP-binding protein [Cryomorphaceae bacterium]|tara:strand:- start:5358 stop:6020 length:663 start_codon:yes stop_codon:yes gene_type:complete